MKKIILVLLIANFMMNIDNCMSQWVWVNPTTNANLVARLKYADANTIYMTQEYGLIMKSTDRGISWFNLYYDSSATFGYLWFSDANKGIVTSRKNNTNLLMKTSNGGYNWYVATTFNNYSSPVSIQFLNSYTGYICMSSNYYRTTNSGISWDSLVVTSDSLFPFGNIYFKDLNTGFISGYTFSQYQGYWGRIYKTTNGGQNWTYERTPWRTCSIQFINDTGYIICENYIMKTVNLGINWNTSLSNFSHWTQDSKFINSQTGFVVGGGLPNNGVGISKTTNGGINWQLTSPIGFTDLYTLDCWDANNLITGGQGGCVIRTTNCGINWISNSVSKEGFFDISFPNSSVGFAVCNNSYLKTTNGGLSWKVDSIPYSYNPNITKSFVKFFNSNTGYLSRDSLYKTTNGGQNWTRMNYGANRNSPVFSFINENTGFVITVAFNFPYPNTSTMFLERTTNGGTTWQETQYTNSVNLYYLCFTDINTGYACGQSYPNTLKKTTNGGLNWQDITSINDFSKFHFINSSNGFLFGNSGLFLTTNGGANFNCVLLDSTMNGFDMNFINENTGYFIKHNYYANTSPKIYKTINGGLNWNQSCSVFKNTRFDFIRFLDATTGLCFGTPGLIIRTTNGGGFMEVRQISSKIPSNYMLFQNYPNPFNPRTIIKIQIKDSRFVTLKIFDILGKEVATLVNEKLLPGIYEVPFSASQFSNYQLPSGVYFYQLRAGDFVETRKLVLLK